MLSFFAAGAATLHGLRCDLVAQYANAANLDFDDIAGPQAEFLERLSVPARVNPETRWLAILHPG